MNSKLENDINIEGQTKRKPISPKPVAPLSKPSNVYERELSPIRNIQEGQQEADPVVVNLSRSMEKGSTGTRKYPIFSDSKQ